MALWVVGDVQGCDDALAELLEAIDFAPARDRVWFCGDLVNRGGQSLGVLRRVAAMGAAAEVVLGNHDLYLLNYCATPPAQRSPNAEFDAVLASPDADDLIDWLRRRPFLHLEGRLALVHAGLDPRWSYERAASLADELQRALRGDDWRAQVKALRGRGATQFHPELAGTKRLRVLADIFTRLRFCDAEGRLELAANGPPGTQPAGFSPWFSHPSPRDPARRLLFGHWAALGYHREGAAVCLDSGYVWGGALTAQQVDRATGELGRRVAVKAEAPREL